VAEFASYVAITLDFDHVFDLRATEDGDRVGKCRSEFQVQSNGFLPRQIHGSNRSRFPLAKMLGVERMYLSIVVLNSVIHYPTINPTGSWPERSFLVSHVQVSRGTVNDLQITRVMG
jgi:hypothetical protein